MIKLFEKYCLPFIRKHIIYVNTVILLMVVMLFLTIGYMLNFFQGLESIEYLLYDLRTVAYHKLKAKKADPDVVLLLQEDSADAIINDYPDIGLSKWPFPRSTWKEILSYLKRAPNRFTVFDIKFNSTENDYQDNLFLEGLLESSEFSGRQNFALGDAVHTSFTELKSNVKKKKIFDAFTLQVKQAYEETETEEKFQLYLINKVYQNILKDVFKSNPASKEIFYDFLAIFDELTLNDFNTLDDIILNNISYMSPKNVQGKFLKQIENVGAVNIENTESLDTVARDNKPIYKIAWTNKINQSLPLVSARFVLTDSESSKLAIKKDFWGNYLAIGSRKAYLNKYGNVFLNWRNKTPGQLNSRSRAFNVIPIPKAIIYERFYTTDPQNGFKILPEDSYPEWFSVVNKVVMDSRENILLNQNDMAYIYSPTNNEQLVSFYLKFLLNSVAYYKQTTENYSLIDDSKLLDLSNGTLKRVQSNIIYYHFNNGGLEEYDVVNNIRLYNYFRSNLYFNYLLEAGNEEINPDIIYYGSALEKYTSNSELIKDDISEKTRFYLEKYSYKNRKLYLHPFSFINKIVVLGEAGAGGDIHTNPIAKSFAGPEIISTGIDNYLNDGTDDFQFLKRAPLFVDVIFCILVVIIVYLVIVYSTSNFRATLVILFIIIIVIVINFALFVVPDYRIWMNLTYPLILIVLTSISAAVYKVTVLDKDKRQIKDLFGKFVSPQILEAVIDNPEMLASNVPRKKHMTVLFSDIRGFTSKSEKMKPEELIPQLNDYLTEMVEVIVMDYNGTLDKFMGDAIMAFWGDPLPSENHALDAVLAGIAMKQHLELLNNKWADEGKPDLGIGIGVNTGEMIVGHMGSPRLIDYTVLGDSVNIASRVEGLNKQYGTQMIITDSTYDMVQDYIEAKYLGETTVKGKTTAIKIYEVIGIKEGANVKFDPNPSLFIDGEIEI